MVRRRRNSLRSGRDGELLARWEAQQDQPVLQEADEETWLDLTSSLQAPVSPYTSVSDGPAPELDMGLWAPQMDRNDSWGILRM